MGTPSSKPDEGTSLTVYGLGQKGESDASPRVLQHDGRLLRYSDPDTILRTAWDWHRSRPNGYAS